MSGQLENIKDYWTLRAEGYSSSVMDTIRTGKAKHWLDIINNHLEPGRKCRILDVGTGPGFFPMILGPEGHDITAVDYTQAMLDEAKANCDAAGIDATFLRMDAQSLDFPDESFDVVISRNLVWDLEDPEKAYREWMRVLKRGGKMMLFDANHYLYLYDREYEEADRSNPERTEHTDVGGVDVRIMRDIARDLPLSRERRPQWDTDLLIEMGVQKLCLETDGRDSYKINVDGKEIYLPYSFFICATK